jgi:hypothetical protein
MNHKKRKAISDELSKSESESSSPNLITNESTIYDVDVSTTNESIIAIERHKYEHFGILKLFKKHKLLEWLSMDPIREYQEKKVSFLLKKIVRTLIFLSLEHNGTSNHYYLFYHNYNTLYINNDK